MSRQVKVSVIGLGYIGLPTSIILSNSGFEVSGFDINKNVVDKINSGTCHIKEPGLDHALKKAISNGLIAKNTVVESDIFLIAVPTPVSKNNKPDLSYVESAIDSIIPVLKSDNLVIIESTIPVGTTELMRQKIFKNRKDLLGKIHLSHCPERVLPGKILIELVENDRIVGGVDERSTLLSCDFYKTFVKGNVFPTSDKIAEMTKLVENAYRDVNIAYANEISMICDKLGIDISELISLANRHPRVDILSPGPGVGGHCIAVDPMFIIDSCPSYSSLIRTARNVNNKKPRWVIEKILPHIRNLDKKEISIVCLGCSYKPNVDDTRESPALNIVRRLQKIKSNKNLNILLCDTYVNESDIDIKINNAKDVVNHSDIILCLVKHDEFLKIDFDNLSSQGKVIIDTCGLWDYRVN